MKTLKLHLTVTILAASAALLAQTGLAQPANLSITNLWPGDTKTNVLWDFSTLTNQLQNIDLKIHKNHTNLQVEVQYPDPVTQDGKGKLTGGPDTNTVAVDSTETGPFQFDGTIVSRGSVSGAKGVEHLTFSTRAFGKAELGGTLHSVSAGATFNVKFDAVNDLITVNQNEHASASGVGSASESRTQVNGFSTNANIMAELGDGSWTLVLNFTNAPSVTKLGGDASVSLASGAVYPFLFKGTYAPHTGKSQLNLKGLDAGLGCILQVTLNTNYDVTRVVGRVSGQTVNIKQ